MDDVEDFKKEFDHEYISSIITNHFSSKLFLQVDKYRLRTTDKEFAAFEASSTDEEDDDDNANAAQRDIDAIINDGDVPVGDMFVNSG